LSAAINAATKAGEIVLHYAETSYSLETKGDGSPVTTADREAERCIRNAVESEFPEDTLLGEELGEQLGSSGYRWIIDPIDGTASFIRGVPLYGTLIGIEHDHRMVAGVINLPGLDEMVFAESGRGAWHIVRGGEPRPAWVSAVSDVHDAMICITSFDYFKKTSRESEFQRITGACRLMRGWSDCYGHMLVATGRADAVVEPCIHPWDVAATMAIIKEAGGRYSDWRGEESALSREGVVSNGRVHDGILRLLRP
jgi:histidinol phosphatase-like enzyme (inositol monophosphatase family)